MTPYINTKNKALCCGCRACEQVCSDCAISMLPDEEGFLYPQVDETICCHCGACSRVCIYSESPTLLNSKAVYAACSRNTVALHESSSGGIFSILAEYVLEQRGFVAGCAFDDSFCARHMIVSRQEELSKMRGSKYVQSDLADSYSLVELLLRQGKTVLFTGTPCQVDGLYRFLGIDYPSLITVDLICHGVPSPNLFQTYLSYLQKREKGKLIDYRFRDKARNGWVSKGSYTIQKGDHCIIKTTSPFVDYYYHYYYLKNSINRLNCYSCPYARPERIGDFSIGDYWSIQDIHLEFDCSFGASLLLVNSDKADCIFDKLKDKMRYFPTDIDAAKRENDSLQHASTMPPERLTVYARIEANGFSETAREDCKLSHFLPMLRRLVPRQIKNFIKKLR